MPEFRRVGLLVRVAKVGGSYFAQSPFLAARFLSARGGDAFQFIYLENTREMRILPSLYYCKCRALDTVTYVASCAEVDVMM